LNPDLIHTHQIGAAWYVAKQAKLRGIPVIHTEHGNHFIRGGGWLTAAKRRWLYHSVARHIDRFCCVSAEIAATVTRWWTVPGRLVEVVPNGIDLALKPDQPTPAEMRQELGIPEDAFVVGTVGRLSEVKRQDRLVRAVASIRHRVPNVRLLIVGDGPERATLESLADTLGIGSLALFAGYQPQPERYLRAMSVFTLTSRSEGFPVSLLEAWAAGVPVVCTAVGGIPDVVADGRTGLLAPPDDENALVAAIERLAKEPALAAGLVRAAGVAVRSYSLESVSDKYESRYRELIAARSGVM